MIHRRFCKISSFCKMFSIHFLLQNSPLTPDKCRDLRIRLSLSSWKNKSYLHTACCPVSKISFYTTSKTSDPNTGTRISRVARNEAQNALFDYLHSTRSFQFTDAEHISKNSPTFLQGLLSEVENEQDIGWSLSRYFRYNPINEFEPFFESLGLKPSEILPLLPRRFMFLSDDDLMLQNFHVLCNYGVPRSKIGKMFKEAMEIFKYEYGVLSSKLQAYELLGLSKQAVIKLVTCCPTLLIGGVNQDFVGVLEELMVSDSERDWIAECLSVKNTYHWNRMLRLLVFLKEMGCSKTDLGKLIRNSPGFLFDDSGNKIYVLVALLMKLGLKTNEMLSLLLQYPHILAGKFAQNLWSAVHFLFEIGMETEEITKIVQTYPQVLGSCSLNKPRGVLTRLKMRRDELCDIIKKDPNQLSTIASRSKRKPLQDAGDNRLHLLEKTSFLLKLGFVENSDEMVRALKQFRGRGDQLQERFDCLVDAGLDYHVVSSMIREAPSVLNQSRDVIENKIYFLEKHLGYPLQSVVTFPTYLCYDIERIRLRFSMFRWLKEKGVVKQPIALSTILACSETRFVRYQVSLHPEGPQEWERLKKSLSPSSSCI
ncbi:transcription termination factor MTEF18, mitochondrial-like [Aristolochia californica]|uniref:transcription termination factor MTEF18, mitochondrial-like n=1 Tax=Aristolochia californica TaxID=171875 RepID=UPI0035E028E5